MKKKNLFLLLTFLWLINAGIGGVSFVMDVMKQGAVSMDSLMLSHLLYMIAALVAAILTFVQYRRHRSDS